MDTPSTTQAPVIPPSAKGPKRWLWLCIGYCAVALGVIGAFLPVLPTTPFLLVAAWAFAKSSPALRQRLYDHPRFGRLLRDWHEQGAIPRKGKIAAVTGMSLSWLFLAVTTPRLPVLLFSGITMLAVAAYILSRPTSASAAPDSPLEKQA